MSGEAMAHVPLRFLPQRLDVLDDELSVAENVARFAPGATNNPIRARLARFLFRGARADQQAATLSGGERFRAALAALLLAEPAPQLLLLDEPTNNLDMASVRQLTSALESYEGALIVASHDLPFLESIGITRWLLLDGELREVTPEDWSSRVASTTAARSVPARSSATLRAAIRSSRSRRMRRVTSRPSRLSRERMISRTAGTP